MPLPGEKAAEPQCFYVPANMVRPTEFCRSRPASVDTMNDEITSLPVVSFLCAKNPVILLLPTYYMLLINLAREALSMICFENTKKCHSSLDNWRLLNHYFAFGDKCGFPIHYDFPSPLNPHNVLLNTFPYFFLSWPLFILCEHFSMPRYIYNTSFLHQGFLSLFSFMRKIVT